MHVLPFNIGKAIFQWLSCVAFMPFQEWKIWHPFTIKETTEYLKKLQNFNLQLNYEPVGCTFPQPPFSLLLPVKCCQIQNPTTGAIIPSYQVLSKCVYLGNGIDVYKRACNQLRNWKFLEKSDDAWVKVTSINCVHNKAFEALKTVSGGPNIQTETTKPVVVLSRVLKWPPIWIPMPCQILYIVEDKQIIISDPHISKTSTPVSLLKAMQVASKLTRPLKCVWTGVAYGTCEGHFLRGEESFVVIRSDDPKGSNHVWFVVYSISQPSGFLSHCFSPWIQNLQKNFLRHATTCMLRAVKKPSATVQYKNDYRDC